MPLQPLQTPSETDVILMAIDSVLSEVHTALPGKIESYDPTTGLAQVKPCLMKKYAYESTAKAMPIIPGVPVLMPRGVKIPVVAGDTCLLIFCERSIDRWLDKGGEVDPSDDSMFEINHAVAIVGLWAVPDVVSAPGAIDSLVLYKGTSYLELKADGSVTINAPMVNLGDTSGAALIRTTDVPGIVAPAGTAGGPCTWTPVPPATGTLKVKAS